jgi:hypothetical protein
MNIFRAIGRKAKSFCSWHVFLHTCFNSDYSFVTAPKSYDEKDIFLNSSGTISPNLKWIGKPSALLQQRLIVKPAQASAQKTSRQNIPL